MRYFTPEVQAMIDSGQIAMRQAIRFNFGSGTYAFWNGIRSQVIDGVTHNPGGILKVDSITGGIGMEAVGLQIRLGQSPQDGLTPAILATIDNEDYHQRPVTISDIYINPQTLTIIFVEPCYRGYVDTIDHQDGPDAGIVVNCESRALDNTREGYRMRSTADQQLIRAGDRFFEHAELAGKVEIFWGRDRA